MIVMAEAAGATGTPATDDDEPAWIAAARVGDRRAFERLYRRHVGQIHGLCRQLCHGDTARAEQATQDAFVRAWERLDSFRGEAPFGAWLHRVTVNVVLGEHRLLRRWTTFEDAEQGGPRPELSVHDADVALGTDLDRALARLPKGARAVLWLHDVEGYKHEEIAEMTGVEVGTSKSQLHRARKLMKEYLQ
ncbi:MAG TPA: RNA polymerase sigma factor [Candidatus Binatia bacterium]|nr:RNA polymerase sigma factor [Candidatus Binatia bacterium]